MVSSNLTFNIFCKINSNQNRFWKIVLKKLAQLRLRLRSIRFNGDFLTLCTWIRMQIEMSALNKFSYQFLIKIREDFCGASFKWSNGMQRNDEILQVSCIRCSRLKIWTNQILFRLICWKFSLWLSLIKKDNGSHVLLTSCLRLFSFKSVPAIPISISAKLKYMLVRDFEYHLYWLSRNYPFKKN